MTAAQTSLYASYMCGHKCQLKSPAMVDLQLLQSKLYSSDQMSHASSTYSLSCFTLICVLLLGFWLRKFCRQAQVEREQRSAALSPGICL